ncbi:MAG: hypothetical protein PVG71_13585 [Anaerolineae bacterium]|jgi:hypothetical protein
MDKEALLRRAAEHIFSTGLDDSGAQLGLANMKYGLAKIHLAQEALGLSPSATFIAAPDLSVTRNSARWMSGFGYGGRITWGDGEQDLVILDLKPNCCGMLVGGLDRLPDGDMVLQRVEALRSVGLSVNGIPLKWDFGESNHFIALFRTTPLSEGGFAPYAFVIHGSGDELRAETAWGDGLYWDQSEALRRQADVLETPFGSLHVLTGQKARGYYDFFEWVEAFAKQRRLLVARRLFDEATVYNNETHQGLVNMNEMALGIYAVRGEEGAILPLTLQAHLPAYLVRSRPNLSDATIDRLGWAERAQRLGVYGRLRAANLVPHGGGYTFPHIQDVVSVIEVEQGRYFELSFVNGEGRQIVNNVRDLPYAYRGTEVVERTVALGLCELVARLEPVYGLKL